MTEPVTETGKKTPKKGTTLKQLGGFLMALGVVFALFTGSFGAVPAILLFGGLITLIVGIAQRDNAPN